MCFHYLFITTLVRNKFLIEPKSGKHQHMFVYFKIFHVDIVGLILELDISNIYAFSFFHGYSFSISKYA